MGIPTSQTMCNRIYWKKILEKFIDKFIENIYWKLIKKTELIELNPLEKIWSALML